jgi:tungstate transport system ATP-binding protein
LSEVKLRIRGLTFSRGERRVLAIDELDVHSGETLVVLGPNGSGKSTLLQLIAALEQPEAGEILVDGDRVDKDRLAWRRRMALVFQEPLLLDTSVERNVASGLSIRGVPRGDRMGRVRDWLGRFGIEGLADRSGKTLSGGEAQRTSLARALVLEPELLLLDEPFAALDAPTKQVLVDDFERVVAQAETTTILVTHDRGEALRLGHRVAVLIDGHIRQVGSAQEVFGAPVDEEVAEFVGIETIVRGEVQEVADGLASVRVGSQKVRAASLERSEADVLVCVRPEDVILSSADQPGTPSSARNHLQAVVRRVVSSGPYVRVELDAGFPLVALITAPAREEIGVEPGAAVAATFKATAVHLISVSR